VVVESGLLVVVAGADDVASTAGAVVAVLDGRSWPDADAQAATTAVSRGRINKGRTRRWGPPFEMMPDDT
jgi:hypothetical protein